MDKIKTGTTTLGIVCKDAIILAADKRTTAGNLIVRKDSEKIHIVADNVVITTAGVVSDIQMVIKLVRAELKVRKKKNNRLNSVKEAASLTSRMFYENARQYFPSVAQVILAGYERDKLRMYEIDVDGATLEIGEFVSTGSGSPLMYGLLEHAFKENMTIKEGEELAVKAISAATQRDNASGNGIDVVVITKDSIKRTIQKKISGVAV